MRILNVLEKEKGIEYIKYTLIIKWKFIFWEWHETIFFYKLDNGKDFATEDDNRSLFSLSFVRRVQRKLTKKNLW